MVFLPATFHLSREDEKERYDHHENQVDDPAYRKFLSTLLNPLLPYLADGQRGIDVGCGPGPALVEMCREAGFAMEMHDPIYADNPQALQKTYDFVTATETVEHFREPAKDWALLNRLLGFAGFLGIMTWRWRGQTAFEQWHYRRDDTHVCFYADETLEWLAQNFGWEIKEGSERYCIFQKR